MTYATFTDSIKNLHKHNQRIQTQIENLHTFEGQNESNKLQMISYHDQYLYLFIIFIFLLLILFRISTSDTTKIDNIIIIIIIAMILYHFYFRVIQEYI